MEINPIIAIGLDKKNYIKRSSSLAITVPVQCHENKSVDGDGSSHVDQVLNNTTKKFL